MTKDVVISVEGLQYDTADSGSIEIISQGEYYFRNGKHFILYDEITEDSVNKNILKISGKKIELNKKGTVNVQMIFEPGKRYMTSYHTPYGNLVIGLHTSKVKFVEEEDYLGVHIDYGLAINYERAFNCTIKIRVRPKLPSNPDSQPDLQITRSGNTSAENKEFSRGKL